MTQAKSTLNQKLRYERLRRGWTQLDLADKIGTTPLNVGRWERGITSPGPYLRQKLCEVYEKSLEELGLVPGSMETEPATAIELISSPVAPSSEAPAMLWHIPYGRNLLFTGREDVLARLRDTLPGGEHPVALAQPQAIGGLGGIGKTQTAVEYAYRYRDNYKSVLWARADSADLLISDFLLIAALLNLPQRNEQDQSVVVKAVLRWFDTHEQWLLTLDNADDLEMVSKFMPSAGKGHVLLTTHANFTGTVAQRIELDKMALDEGTLLLLRRMKYLKGNAGMESVSETIRTQARAIVEAVDGLPLALDQAGAYIEETGCTLSDYLKFYTLRHNRLLRMRGASATGHPEPVATTWSLSFEKVERANPAAAELLHLCAFLHPDEIPESMIIEGASESGPLLQAIAEDELDWNEAIGELRKYSLVKRDAKEKILNIHRLVQMVIRDGMDKETQRVWAKRTVLMVNRAFPEDVFSSWNACQLYLPHVQICAALIKQWNIDSTEAIDLLSRTAYYLRRRAQFNEAVQLFQDELAIRLQVSGPEHIEIANDIDNLAWVYLDMGKYEEARALFEQARLMREHLSGPDHLDTTKSLNALGLLYREQGEYLQAEALFEQALTLRTKILGLEHPLVGESSNNLALIYGDIGKYAEAEPLHQQALAIDEKFLGKEHPEVATDLNNIGWNYYRQGRYDLVEAPHLRALAIRERILGLEHPDVAFSLNALGLLYRDLGRYTEAEAFLQRALLIRERALGSDHVDVGQSLQNLGVLCYRQGRYHDAEAMLRRSLVIREQLGTENPLIAFSLNPLAILYRSQGKYSEAEPLLKRAIAIREKALGPDNIDLSYSLEALAVLYSKLERYEEAGALFQRVLAIQENVLGPKHLYVAQTRFGFALLYYNQENYAQAELLFQQALAIQEKSLLAMSSDVAVALKNYASLLRKTNRKAEAIALEERIQNSRVEEE